MIDHLLQRFLRRTLPPEIYNDDNPVFHLNFAHHQLAPTVDDLLRRTKWAVVVVSLVTVIVWGITVLPLILDRKNMFADPIGVIVGYLLMSFWVNVALDNDAITASVESVPMWLRRQNSSLMQAALFRSEDVVRTKYAIAQLHVWGRMIGVMTFRAVLIILLLVDVIFFTGFQASPVRTLLEIILTMLAGFAFAVEPLYRTRAMSALGVIIHSRRNVLSGLQAWMVIVALWVVQIVIAAVTLGLVSLLFRPLLERFPLAHYLELGVSSLIMIFLFYNLYLWMSQSALHYAINDDNDIVR